MYMTAKKRIVDYLKYKGISQYEFSRRTGLSNGFLNSGDNINSANLDVITNSFRDINLMWLVKGTGPMVISDEMLVVAGETNMQSPYGNANDEFVDWLLNDEENKQLQHMTNKQLVEMNKIAKRLILAKNETIKAKDDKIESLEKIIIEKEKTEAIKDRLIVELEKNK